MCENHDDVAPNSPIRTTFFLVYKIHEFTLISQLNGALCNIWRQKKAATHHCAPQYRKCFFFFFSLCQFILTVNFGLHSLGKDHTMILKSHGVFHSMLWDNLQSLHQPSVSVLLQYIDDLMICSPSWISSKQWPQKPSHLQFAQTCVTYLWHLIAFEGKSKIHWSWFISAKTIMSYVIQDNGSQTIQREAPLSPMIHGKNLSADDKMCWLRNLFTDWAHIRTAKACLPKEQFYGISSDTIRWWYFSTKLDLVAAVSLCLRAVAVADKTWWLHHVIYEDMPNIKVKRCTS